MAHVPDEFILGCGEDAVQGHGEFHDAEVRAEMAAIDRQLGDEFVPDLVRQLQKLIGRQFLYV